MKKVSLVNSNESLFDPADQETQGDRPYKLETEMDDYSPDTLADPEGCAIREEVIERSDYPAWVFNENEISDLTVWGNPNPDGKLHLRPTSTTIAGVMRYTKISDRDHVALTEMRDNSLVDIMITSYKTILDEMYEKADKYQVMLGIGQATNNALVDRAIWKYRYHSNTGRLTVSTDQVPEYIEDQQMYMLVAAERAANWLAVHANMWTYVGYPKVPQYFLERGVKEALSRSARYIEKKYKAVKPATATVGDYQKFDIAC